MKKSLFLVAALAAVTSFSSCSKDENQVTSGDNVLVVKLPNATSRVVEDAVPGGATTKTTITTATIFLIAGNSVSDVVDFTSTEIGLGYKRIEQVSSTVTDVIVIANIPTGEVATVKALTNAPAIEQYAYTIASQQSSVSLPGISGKTLFGKANALTTTDPNPDGHIYKEASVTLNSLTARIEIGTVKAGTGVVTVDLVGVWINNYYTNGSKSATEFNASTALCWDITPATTASPSATPFGSTFTIPSYTESTYYNAADNTNVTLSASSKVYAFHVFPGNLPHVILLVKGEYASGHYNLGADGIDGTADDQKYFLGWLTFVKYDDGSAYITSMEANKIYKMGVGATGIVVDADKITPDPELNNFDLGIKITVASWTAVNVTPEAL